MKSQCYNISSEKHLLIVKLPVVLKQSNLDETTYDNYREFDNICLQHDRQTTASVKTPKSKTDYNSRY